MKKEIKDLTQRFETFRELEKRISKIFKEIDVNSMTK
jgi:hypothetical protein